MRYFLIVMGMYSVLIALKDVIAKILLDEVNTLALTFYVSIFCTVFSFLILLASGSRLSGYLRPSAYDRATILKLFAVSVVYAVAFPTLIFAISLSSPVLFSIIDTPAYPVFVALLSFLLVREHIPRSRLYGLAVAVSGIIVFQFRDFNTLTFSLALGIPFVLLASFLDAVSITIVKMLLNVNVAPEIILFVRFLVLDMLLFLFLSYSGQLTISTDLALKLALLALFGYVVPFYMSFRLLQNVPVNLFGLGVLSIPILSTVFTATLVPSVTISLPQVVGVIIVIMGIVIGLSGGSERSRPATDSS